MKTYWKEIIIKKKTLYIEIADREIQRELLIIENENKRYRSKDRNENERKKAKEIVEDPLINYYTW